MDSSPRRGPFLGAHLRAHAPSGPPVTFSLTSRKCVVGRAPECNMVIADRSISRCHAEFEIVDDGVLVRDLGSGNGTFYLDQRVESIVLSVGSSVRLGRILVSIEVDPGLFQPATEFVGDEYRGVIGTSGQMRKLFGILARLESSLVTVLLEGESGAGKEVISQAIHRGSSLSNQPLVVLNCGAVSKELVASELFGHVRGAFTGAVAPRKGAFESADSGTLFLDEIGELPLAVQPMLLRALETGEIRAVGSDRTRQVKVRLIAATNRNLEEDVQAGAFREDLFYRLAVVRLRVPSLRERPDDIRALANSFASAAGAGELPDDVVEHLKARSWPGNVRELRNVVQAYIALGAIPSAGGAAPHGMLELCLRQLVDVARPYAEQKDALIERFSEIYLKVLLAHTAGNQSAAANLAGLDRGYLGKLAAKFGLSRVQRSDE